MSNKKVKVDESLKTDEFTDMSLTLTEVLHAFNIPENFPEWIYDINDIYFPEEVINGELTNENQKYIIHTQMHLGEYKEIIINYNPDDELLLEVATCFPECNRRIGISCYKGGDVWDFD